jgi:hypothetical protein
VIRQLRKGLAHVRRLVSWGGWVEAVCRLEVDADVLVNFAQPGFLDDSLFGMIRALAAEYSLMLLLVFMSAIRNAPYLDVHVHELDEPVDGPKLAFFARWIDEPVPPEDCTECESVRDPYKRIKLTRAF